MKCPKCKQNSNKFKLVTEAEWGQGDSTYTSYIICTECGHKGVHVHGWGLFPENQEWRHCQKEFLED